MSAEHKLPEYVLQMKHALSVFNECLQNKQHIGAWAGAQKVSLLALDVALGSLVCTPLQQAATVAQSILARASVRELANAMAVGSCVYETVV